MFSCLQDVAAAHPAHYAVCTTNVPKDTGKVQGPGRHGRAGEGKSCHLDMHA